MVCVCAPVSMCVRVCDGTVKASFVGVGVKGEAMQR